MSNRFERGQMVEVRGNYTDGQRHELNGCRYWVVRYHASDRTVDLVSNRASAVAGLYDLSLNVAAEFLVTEDELRYQAELKGDGR